MAPVSSSPEKTVEGERLQLCRAQRCPHMSFICSGSACLPASIPPPTRGRHHQIFSGTPQGLGWRVITSPWTRYRNTFRQIWFHSGPGKFLESGQIHVLLRFIEQNILQYLGYTYIHTHILYCITPLLNVDLCIDDHNTVPPPPCSRRY